MGFTSVKISLKFGFAGSKEEGTTQYLNQCQKQPGIFYWVSSKNYVMVWMSIKCQNQGEFTFFGLQEQMVHFIIHESLKPQSQPEISIWVWRKSDPPLFFTQVPNLLSDFFLKADLTDKLLVQEKGLSFSCEEPSYFFTDRRFF